MSRQDPTKKQVGSQSLFVVLAVLLVLGACGKKKAEEARDPQIQQPMKDVGSASSATPAIDAGLKEHMQEHFQAIRSIERALVLGDLQTAKDQARYLANHKMSDEVTGHQQEALQVQSAARVFAESADAQSAPLAAARLAASCGNCHLAATAITSFEWVPAPAPDAGDAKLRMRRHLWAMDRLWEGLVGPSQVLWKEGAEVLSSAPFPLANLVKDKVPEEQRLELSETLKTLAKSAKQANTQSERAQVYGGLLGTCVACHAARTDQRTP